MIDAASAAVPLNPDNVGLDTITGTDDLVAKVKPRLKQNRAVVSLLINQCTTLQRLAFEDLIVDFRKILRWTAFRVFYNEGPTDRDLAVVFVTVRGPSCALDDPWHL